MSHKTINDRLTEYLDTQHQQSDERRKLTDVLQEFVDAHAPTGEPPFVFCKECSQDMYVAYPCDVLISVAKILDVKIER